MIYSLVETTIPVFHEFVNNVPSPSQTEILETTGVTFLGSAAVVLIGALIAGKRFLNEQSHLRRSEAYVDFICYASWCVSKTARWCDDYLGRKGKPLQSEPEDSRRIYARALLFGKVEMVRLLAELDREVHAADNIISDVTENDSTHNWKTEELRAAKIAELERIDSQVKKLYDRVVNQARKEFKEEELLEEEKWVKEVDYHEKKGTKGG
jgi:hypothetical protein